MSVIGVSSVEPVCIALPECQIVGLLTISAYWSRVRAEALLKLCLDEERGFD
jgi:hypothetical protein